MRILNILKCTLSSLLLFIAGSVSAQQQTDTATDTKPVKAKEMTTHQLSVSFDIIQPIANALESYRTGYELAADYYLRNQVYAVAEGGWGKCNVDYSDLKYTTNNSFFRIGINKCLLARMMPKDWDMAFIGVRYAMAFAQRGNGTFTTTDSLWGNTSGSIPGKSFTPYWAEVTGGVRVELAKCLFAGWTVRGKFMLNSNSFKDLSPLYIAGYGKGDKSAVFDFNFYITYAIRWKRKHEI